MSKARRSFVGVLMIVSAIVAAPALSATKTDKKQNKALKELKQSRQQLQSGLEEVKGGLAQLGTALASGLQEAAASLSALDTAFTGYVDSSEYGVVQLYFDPEGDGFEANDAVPGQLLTSGDIPDDANQATVTGKLFLSIPDGTTSKPIALKAGIRSGETDGTGAANPAGQAGLMAMTIEVIGSPGMTSAGGGNPGAPTTLPLATKANTSLGGAPVYGIPSRAPRIDATPDPFTFPDNLTIELTDPSTLQTLTSSPGRFTVTNTSGAPAVGVVNVTVRFHDLSTSTTNLEE